MSAMGSGSASPLHLIWVGKLTLACYKSSMLHKRDLAGVISVDGLEYNWAVQRVPQWCTVDGWRGMTIALGLRDAKREAILEFPMPSDRRSRLQPQLRRPQINKRILENGVRPALSAGWDPTSRGRPVICAVDANGCLTEFTTDSTTSRYL